MSFFNKYSLNLNNEAPKLNNETLKLNNDRLEVSGLSKLIKASMLKDQDTGEHIARVAFMALELTRLANIKTQDDIAIFFASALHDIGKISIPDNVLTKKGKLSDDEWITMREHCASGAALFQQENSAIEDACFKVAMFHHENFDGTGYPLGISGESIPIEARVLSIVDAYDALTMERCYRSAMTHSDALRVMTTDFIGKFDKELLNIFLKNNMNFDMIRLIFEKFGAIENMSVFYA